MEPTITVDPTTGNHPATTPALPRGATLDRYVVLEPLGHGGMGVVYSAFDPELDRKVALKVVHPQRLTKRSGQRTQRRLAREAQALAQLSHPHVLAVHDVGVVGGQIFVATELVDGCDLEAWLKETPRKCPEILAVFRQAGAGLAAAHAAGLVHRDFKLSNVMVGRDGRVRVVDFGLASRDRPRESEEGQLAVPAAVVGTPTYAAPEQLAGQPVTAAADQFSFCVSLFRALCGEPPFPAAAAERPTDAASWILDETPLARLPAALRRLLLRGLRFEPAARYPSMEALLGELEAIEEGRRRRRRLAALAAAALGAAAAVTVAFTLYRQSLCTGGTDRFATVWNTARKQTLTAAFHNSPLSYAGTSWRGAEAIIDRYGERWSEMHDAACRATTVEGVQSAELLDRRMACLERRLHEVDALATELARGGAMAERAVAAAGALGPLDACADVRALLAPTPPSTEAAEVEAVADLRLQLASVETLLSIGESGRGHRRAEELVAEAESIGHWPSIAEALLLKARFEETMDHSTEADLSLERALEAAQAGGHDRVAAAAFVHRVRVAGYQRADFERGVRYARQAEAALERLARPEELAATLAANRGAVLMQQGDFPAALAAHREALEKWTRARGERAPSTGVALGRVGDVLLETGALEEAAKHFEGALEIARRHYGDTHPLSAKLMAKVGTVLLQRGDPIGARRFFEQSLAATRATLPPDNPYLATPLTYLGHALVASGAHAEATARYREALAILDSMEEPDPRRLSTVSSGLGRAASSIGDYEEAARSYGRALALRESVYGDGHPAVAEAAFNLGEVAKKRGDHQTALERYRQALGIWQRTLPDNGFLLAAGLTGVGEALLGLGDAAAALPPLERALRLHPPGREREFLATTQFALARALTGADREADRAQVLAIAARDGFARGRATSRDELSRVEAWLAARSPSP